MRLGQKAAHFLAVAAVILFACQGVMGTCSDPDVARNDHIEAIKRYILLKLDLKEPPENPDVLDSTESSDKEVDREYEALVTAGEYTSKMRKPCVTQYDDSSPELLVYFPRAIKEVFYYYHPSELQPDSNKQGLPVPLYEILL